MQYGRVSGVQVRIQLVKGDTGNILTKVTRERNTENSESMAAKIGVVPVKTEEYERFCYTVRTALGSATRRGVEYMNKVVREGKSHR